MTATTAMNAREAWNPSATSERAPRHGHRSDPVLVTGVVAVALALALLLSMLPGFARVPVDGSAVAAPTPAPAPVVESAR